MLKERSVTERVNRGVSSQTVTNRDADIEVDIDTEESVVVLLRKKGSSEVQSIELTREFSKKEVEQAIVVYDWVIRHDKANGPRWMVSFSDPVDVRLGELRWMEESARQSWRCRSSVRASRQYG